MEFIKNYLATEVSYFKLSSIMCPALFVPFFYKKIYFLSPSDEMGETEIRSTGQREGTRDEIVFSASSFRIRLNALWRALHTEKSSTAIKLEKSVAVNAIFGYKPTRFPSSIAVAREAHVLSLAT